MVKDIAEYQYEEHHHEERQERDKTPAPKVNTAPIRKSIADLARSFVAAAHYLEGTAGNSPGNQVSQPDANGN